MRVTGESVYGDSMETVLYNTILGARPIHPDGVSFYYADYSQDAAKVDYEQRWPCCSGTFPQLTADYGISSYLRDGSGVYVNLYVPSKVTWRQGGTRVSLTQQTQYPKSPETSLSIQMERTEQFTVALRMPAWAGAGTTIRVNGRPVGVEARPGTWAKINRRWSDGDRIEMRFDMPLRLVALDAQHPNLVALVRGPAVLFAINPAINPGKVSREELLAARRVSQTSPDWIVSTAGGEVTMRPYPQIDRERYRLYQQV